MKVKEPPKDEALQLAARIAADGKCPKWPVPALYRISDTLKKLRAENEALKRPGRDWNFTCEACGKHSDIGKGWTADEDAVWLCAKCSRAFQKESA